MMSRDSWKRLHRDTLFQAQLVECWALGRVPGFYTQDGGFVIVTADLGSREYYCLHCIINSVL